MSRRLPHSIWLWYSSSMHSHGWSQQRNQKAFKVPQRDHINPRSKHPMADVRIAVDGTRQCLHGTESDRDDRDDDTWQKQYSCASHVLQLCEHHMLILVPSKFPLIVVWVPLFLSHSGSSQRDRSTSSTQPTQRVHIGRTTRQDDP